MMRLTVIVCGWMDVRYAALGIEDRSVKSPATGTTLVPTEDDILELKDVSVIENEVVSATEDKLDKLV